MSEFTCVIAEKTCLPHYLMDFKTCLDCGSDAGMGCKIMSWERNLKRSLLNSMNMKGSMTKTASVSSMSIVNNNQTQSAERLSFIKLNKKESHTQKQIAESRNKLGKACTQCQKVKLVLIRTSSGCLVCQNCLKSKRYFKYST